MSMGTGAIIERSSVSIIMASNVEGDAVGLDAHHALTVKGAPSTLAFLAGNGEVAAADDRRVLGGGAGALDLGGVAGIELQLADGAISLAELHRDDGGAGIKDELTDQLGLGLGEQSASHGERKRGALAPLLTIVPMEPAPCKPPDQSVLLIGTMRSMVPSEHQGVPMVVIGAPLRRIVTVCSSAGDQH